MKRSEINTLVRLANECFSIHRWALPPNPHWDVTDFGLGDWKQYGLVLVNLADEKEYCEKLMYAQKGMRTPAHCHAKKKEDIIVRAGSLRMLLWRGKPGHFDGQPFDVQVNRTSRQVLSGEVLDLHPGERVTLLPGIYHEFFPTSEECILGEVSTANDDLHDNFFVDTAVGRFSAIDEDEPAIVRLVSDP